MSKTLRVGIVGASADGWAKESHVPAVRKLAGLELAAIATSNQKSADTAAKAFGVERGYGDAADLLRDPGVDVVAVCVKLPAHRKLVLDAFAARKHVLCEWPLGRNVAETEELTYAARTAGVCAAIGLQVRMNPEALRARELIASGAMGRLLSVRIYSSTAAFGPQVPANMAYSEDPENGVSVVTIQGAHTFDLAIALGGALENVAALTTIQYSEVEVGDEAATRKRPLPDHVLVAGRLAAGGALSVEVAGGRPPGETPFRLEAVGQDGSLVLDGGALRGFQSGRLSLRLNGELQAVDEGETASLPDMAANVAGIYAAFRDDIRNGTSKAPDFEHALRLARFVDDVMSSQTPERESSQATGHCSDDDPLACFCRTAYAKI